MFGSVASLSTSWAETSGVAVVVDDVPEEASECSSSSAMQESMLASPASMRVRLTLCLKEDSQVSG